jgi:hypothetical protein
MAGLITVFCQCGGRLGQVGPSILSGNPRPVWRIEPGWSWSDTHLGRGTLECRDETFTSERRLYHELTGGRRPEGMAMLRECDLPICIRCPKCHRTRWVSPDVVFAGSPG